MKNTFLKAIQSMFNGQKVSNAYVLNGTSMLDLLSSQAAASGYAVNESNAMRVSAVYSCVRLIAGSISTLPLPVYERTADGRKKVDSPLWYVLNEQPTAQWTAASMWEWIIKSICLRGDSFAVIERNAAGVVTGIRPLHTSQVRVSSENKRLQYLIHDNGTTYGKDQDDILHFTGFGFDGISSPSVIQQAAFQSIGIALAADEFSGKFYANGAMSKQLISTDGKMSAEQVDTLRASYKSRYSGADNAGLPMVLTEGLKLTELSMTAADAELLDSRKFQVIDIARAFGVPPHMIGAQETTSSWGSGIESMAIGFVKFTLSPYLERIEQELNRKLFRTSKYFVEFSVEGLMRGDSKAEADYLRQAIGGSQGIGWMTVNEARKIKNLPPIEGGDTLYDPKNMGEQDTKIQPQEAPTTNNYFTIEPQNITLPEMKAADVIVNIAETTITAKFEQPKEKAVIKTISAKRQSDGTLIGTVTEHE